MTVLRDSPYSLEFQDYVVVKIRAKNALGWGEYSDLNALMTQIQVEPGQAKPVRRGTLTSTSRIQLLWDPLTTSAETGDSLIRSYHLQWDSDGTNRNFVDLVGFSEPYALTQFIATGTQPGVVYHFRIRARNKWGFGPWSQVVAI